jgi:hypothetical protein
VLGAAAEEGEGSDPAATSSGGAPAGGWSCNASGSVRVCGHANVCNYQSVVYARTDGLRRLLQGRMRRACSRVSAAGGDLRASYTLTAPTWSNIDGNDTRSSTAVSYSTPYKLRVSLRIDATNVTIESAELEREPQMVT